MATRSLLAPLSDPDYEDLMAESPKVEREPPTVQLQWCPVCREWMREGSAEYGECVDCGTPRS